MWFVNYQWFTEITGDLLLFNSFPDDFFVRNVEFSI